MIIRGARPYPKRARVPLPHPAVQDVQVIGRAGQAYGEEILAEVL